MPNLWITSSGRILVVPYGLIHADVAENMGLNHIQAFRQGWIRTTGSEQNGWNFEVWDIRRDETQNLIEDFLYSHHPGDRWTNIQSWQPYEVSLLLKPRDIEGASIKEAIQSKLERKINFPAMGSAKIGMGGPQGRRINKIWSATNPRGECFVIARIGSGQNAYLSTLGNCEDPEVKRFWALWREGFVRNESDIDKHLRQPLEDVPAPEGGALTARPVDIERELDLARNMYGKLKPTERTRLRAVLYQPTEETWDDAYSIIVGGDGWMTLWQAVIAVDPTFPRMGPATDVRGRTVERWKRIPSQEVLLAALRYATH